MSTPTTASGGRHPSLWTATTPATSYPALDGSAAVDVAVVGGGITGLTAAVLLAEAGVRVAVIEARAIATGTTGNTTAKVTALQALVYSELTERHGEEAARAYAEANRAAVELVGRWGSEPGADCDLRRCPAVTYTESADRRGDIEAEAEAARRAGLGAEYVERTALPFPVAAAVRLDEQLLFHPRKYCLRLAERLIANGGRIHEQTRITGIEEQGGAQVLTGDAGTVRAEHVIVATLLPFPLDGGYFAKAFPNRSYALSARVEGDVPWEMCLSVDSPSRSVRPHPGDDGDLLVIEGDSHKTGQDEDARRHYDAVEGWARERFPVVDIPHRWSAQDYTPSDGIPYVGPLSTTAERVLVATGFRKWGMSNGTAAAMMMADRVLGRPNPWQDVFRSTRLNPGVALPELVKENLDVGKRFVADRVRSALAADSVDDLRPGEAAVVRAADGKVAAYRDEAGALHAVSPVCTHLGCEVSWNSAELSWDCPCHGSRFEYTGAVIEGPATRALEVRDLGARPPDRDG